MQRRPAHTRLLLKARGAQLWAARSCTRVKANVELLEMDCFQIGHLCSSLSSYWLKSWLKGENNTLACSHIKSEYSHIVVKLWNSITRRVLAKKKSQISCKNFAAWTASVCVCVWPYFRLSVVCSYSNQYVSCLHWSGPDNHHSYMVSPQQMQEADTGLKERNQMRGYNAAQDEKISLKHTVQMLFTCQTHFFFIKTWQSMNCARLRSEMKGKADIGFHIKVIEVRWRPNDGKWFRLLPGDCYTRTETFINSSLKLFLCMTVTTPQSAIEATTTRVLVFNHFKD